MEFGFFPCLLSKAATRFLNSTAFFLSGQVEMLGLFFFIISFYGISGSRAKYSHTYGLVCAVNVDLNVGCCWVAFNIPL